MLLVKIIVRLLLLVWLVMVILFSMLSMIYIDYDLSMLKLIVLCFLCVKIEWVLEIIIDVNEVLIVIFINFLELGVKKGNMVRRVGIIIKLFLLLKRLEVMFVIVFVMYKVRMN